MRHGPHTSYGKRECEEDVDTRIEYHVQGDAVESLDSLCIRTVGRNGAVDQKVSCLLAESVERAEVYQDGTEFDREDPDILRIQSVKEVKGAEDDTHMTPEPFTLECRRDPAPSPSPDKVLLAMHGDSHSRQEVRQHPKTNDRSDEDFAADPTSQCCGVVGVDCNCQHEETTADVSRMQKPALTEAGWRWSQDVAFSIPVPADEERSALLEIGNQEVEDQDDVLVVADERLVVKAPGDESGGDEDDECCCAGHREGGEDGDGDQSVPEVVGQFGRAVRWRKVVLPVHDDERRVREWHCGWRRLTERKSEMRLMW